VAKRLIIRDTIRELHNEQKALRGEQMTVNLTQTNGNRIQQKTIDVILQSIANSSVSPGQVREFFEPNADPYTEFLSAYLQLSKQYFAPLLAAHGKTLYPEGFGTLTTAPIGAADEGLASLVFFDDIIAPHMHEQTDADILVLAGTGYYQLGNDRFEYNSRTQICVPKGSVHGFIAETPTLFVAKETYGRIMQRDGGLGDTVFTDAHAQHAYDAAAKKSDPQLILT
jgi:hypothetical protein